MAKLFLYGITIAAFILFNFTVLLQGVTTRGMTGFWKFDGNAEDVSGYGHNGTLHNGPIYVTGRVGKCLEFDCGRAYMTAGNNDGRLTASRTITIEAWIKGNNFENGYRHIYYKNDSHTLSVYNGKVAAKSVNGWWKPGSTALRTGEWYHVAWTYDGSFNRIYINGIERASMSAPGTLARGGDVYISHPKHGFDGLIDEVKVYDRPLTAIEIKSSYYEGKALTGYWPLDGNANDRGGSGYDGTIRGNAQYEGSIAGLGLKLPGKKGHVLIKKENHGPALTKEMTITAWIMGDDFGPSMGHIYDNAGSHALSVFNGKLALTCAGETWKPGSTGLEPGRWYYVAGTYDGKRKKLYINGKLAAAAEQTGSLPPGSTLRIGHDSSGFRGLIDEVKEYDKALPADVIEQNYLDVPQPEAIWSFDNNARDKSGYGHHGKLINGPRYVEGKVNRCLYFDGNNDYVLLDNSDGRLDFVQIVTIEAWIKGYGFKNDFQHIYDKYGGATLSVKDGKLALGGRGGWMYPSSTALSPHRWYHVIGTIDMGEKRLYINGVLKDSIPIKDVVSTGDAAYISQPYFTFNGLIDEVKIYNCALSPREVLLHYLAGCR